MTAQQPAAPPAPATPNAHAASGVPDHLAQQLDGVNRAVEAASRMAAARAAGAGQVGVVKSGTGTVVVTGPDGRTVTIDPRVGLDGDQIQAIVQNTLQPQPIHRGPDIPDNVVPIVAIVFSFLFLIALVMARAISGRRTISRSTTAVLPREADARLVRIEQAVEAVAIEVERISEAQRYSAQLLTDRLPDAGAALAPTSAAPAARG